MKARVAFWGTVIVFLFTGLISRTHGHPRFGGYYPIGNDLIWRYTVKEGVKEYTQRVVCKLLSGNDNDACVFALTTCAEEAGWIRRKISYYYTIKGDTIFLKRAKLKLGLLGISISVSNRPQLPVFLLSPGDSVTTWTWCGFVRLGLKKRRLCIGFEVKQPEMLSTPIGKVLCKRLKITCREGATEQTCMAWFGKGVGLVRFMSPSQQKELIEFRIAAKGVPDGVGTVSAKRD